jgi:hypothetical protein
MMLLLHPFLRLLLLHEMLLIMGVIILLLHRLHRR